MRHVKVVEHSVRTLLLGKQVGTYLDLIEYEAGSRQAAVELALTVQLAMIVDRLHYRSFYSSDLTRAKRILGMGRPTSEGLAAVKWALSIHDQQIDKATWPEFSQALDVLLQV